MRFWGGVLIGGGGVGGRGNDVEGKVMEEEMVENEGRRWMSMKRKEAEEVWGRRWRRRWWRKRGGGIGKRQRRF